MAEPITVSALALGVLGSYLANRADDTQRGLAGLIKERLKKGGKELPPNHDVQRACRDALRQAIELMAQAMELQVVEPKNLIEALKNRYDSDGNWKPLFDRWHTDEGDWLREFLAAVRDDKSLGQFNLQPVTGASSLGAVVRSQSDKGLEAHFPAAMLDWTERHVLTGKQPEFFNEWVNEGWPIAPEAPGVRTTLYQAWCLFFQAEIKQSEEVFRILTVDWLAKIDEQLSSANINRDDFDNWLGDELGEQRELLEGLRDAVAAMAQQLEGVALNVGQLMPLVAEFREEVKDDLSGLLEQLTSQNETLATVDATTTRTEVKVDQALQLLKELAAREQAAPPPDDAAPEVGAAGIAESKLLDSDGAARLQELIGRDREKGLLTRAWNSTDTNVVVFVAWGGVGKTALVTDWFSQRFPPHWSGVDAFFDWSFYSQGTKDQSSANSEVFMSAALRHFGDAKMAASAQDADTKARRLAQLIAQQRTLLILDGVEPLQHPKKPHGLEGRFKDPGIERLLKSLAQAQMPGLCVVTTREPVVDLQPFHTTTVREYSLGHLTVKRGAELLHLSGANQAVGVPIERDDQELLAAAKEVRGHALTLQLLGGYLKAAHQGDIRRRDRVDFAKAFEQQLEGHAHNVMEAYERWFEENGESGQRQLAALRLTGLFDRPVDPGCLAALRAQPPIPDLTDSLVDLDESDLNQTLHQLEEHQLLVTFGDLGSDRLGIDAHPLVREYFAQQLRGASFQLAEKLEDGEAEDRKLEAYATGEAWRAGHRRLYEHLCETTNEGDQPTLEELQPLYQAVAHGCHAGLVQETFDDVYYGRIKRRNEHYSAYKLGALGADLGATVSFFERPWRKPSRILSSSDQAALLNFAAFYLRALGRLTESLEPMRVTIELLLAQDDLKNAAVNASNLSELELTLGEMSGALSDAERCVTYADRSGDAFQRMARRTTHADALHQSGRRSEAESLFREAEQMQADDQPAHPLLYSLGGFRYCDLLLAPAERESWRVIVAGLCEPGTDCESPASQRPITDVIEACRNVTDRATQTLNIAERNNWLLDIALDHLTLSLATLYESLLSGSEISDSASPICHRSSEIEAAVSGLRRAGAVEFLIRGLLTRAWQRSLLGQNTGPDSAQSDLDEAWEIASRGPMPLFMADIHLYRARLFGLADDEAYPWVSAEHDLAEAERLISKHGYGRREEELADAKRAILGPDG